MAGIRQTYTVADVKERIVSNLDQLLMSWIGKEGRDMFNLQMDAAKIADGICMDLDMDITNALMLDGGGSSNMLVEENGVLELKTHIYSNGGTDTAYGTERALADALVIIKD